LTQAATLLPKQLGLLVSSATGDSHFAPILKQPRLLRLARVMASRSFHDTWSRLENVSWSKFHWQKNLPERDLWLLVRPDLKKVPRMKVLTDYLIEVFQNDRAC
jgi:hypothetical protein